MGAGLVWSEVLDTVIGADRVIALAYATPASGAVLLPVNNFALRDRDAGVISGVNSSLGAWRKLERIRREPRVALAYHTRTYSGVDDPRFLLVQGRASLRAPVPDYPGKLGERWERFEPWSETPALWKRWQRVYALRVQIDVTVERILVWPDPSAAGRPEVFGAPLSGDPPSQSPPAKGTGPRLSAARAARASGRLSHVLLGWVGDDGFPVVAPVAVVGGGRDGIELRAAPGLVPPGSRRAGLTAHSFSPGSIGQNQRKYTGWLEAGEEIIYAPHTASNYRFPASKTLYRLITGGAARWGLRSADRAGFEPRGG